MKSKSLFTFVTMIIALAMILSACAPAATPAPTAAPAEDEKPVAQKVVLIGNQKFGDKGPMDDMAAGLDRCAADFGFEIKKLESEPAQYEEDVRSMAREGYNLVITTFPAMTDPTKTVAQEFPNVNFAAVYQFVNVEGASIKNLWDTEFTGQQAYYLLGSIAANMTKSKKVGLVSGTEEASINANANAFYRGVTDTCPDCEVSQSYVGSFEDPAKAKEIAKAMISNGVDYIQTDTGKSQLGVIEASKEAGTLFSGDTSDNYDLYPQGIVGYGAVSFATNVYMACQYLADGKFPGGEHGLMGLENKGQYVPYEAFERFGTNNPDYADAVKTAVETAKALEAKIISGELVIENNTNTPNW